MKLSLWIHRRDMRPSEQAILSADESYDLAEIQHDHVASSLPTTRRLTQVLREHREANHFDDWVMTVFLGDR